MANSKAAVQVKVVLIEYHHIQTDESNFKSVVQRLTGMHSAAVEGCRETRKRRRVDESISSNNVRGRFEESGEWCTTDMTSFMHTASFKDLDLLLKLELPSTEDLSWILAD